MRANRPLGPTAVLYEPSIVIVCQARKRGFLGDETYLYDAQNYLVLSVPLSLFTETEASLKEPLLAVSLRLDTISVADLVLTPDREGEGTKLHGIARNLGAGRAAADGRQDPSRDGERSDCWQRHGHLLRLEPREMLDQT